MYNTVSSVVWPWREKLAAPASPKQAAPKASSVLIQAAVMAAIGAGLYFWLKHTAMGLVVWCLAGVVLVSGFFLPPVFRAIERFGQWLGRAVGVLLTWGLLAPFYYIVFFPMHLVQKLSGKDPLQRRLHSSDATYWTPRPPVRNPAQYRKQF